MSDNIENQDPEATNEPKPEKKKTSVKVVRRVKSKKSEKSDKIPELAPPPSEASEKSAESRKTSLAPPSVAAELSVPAASERHHEPAQVTRVSSRKRMQRSGSNVFAMFTQNQVHQFKEAFSFIDQDKDGLISKGDIRASFDALGRLCTEKELQDMVSEAPGPINFTMFLSVFGDRIQGTDDEDVVLAAFNQFDEGDGKCSEEKLRHVLTTWGTKFTKEECDMILDEAKIDSRGRVDIKQLATLVTRGADEEDN